MNRRLGLKLNIDYAGMQACYWMLYCMILGFASLFLQARGYTGTQIGVVLAVSNMLALLFQPTAASIADRSAKVSLVQIMLALCAGTTALAAVAIFISARSALLSAAWALCFSFVLVLQPLLTSLSFSATGVGERVNFGVCRALGSLAFAALSAAMGVIVEHAGVSAIPAAAVIIGLIFIALLIIYGRLLRGRGAVPSAGAAAPAGRSVGEFLKANPRFAVFLVGVALIFATHSIHNNFLLYIVQDVGGDSGDMGLLFAFMAGMEMPAMMLFDRLTRRFSCSGLLRFALIMFTVKAAAIYLAPSVPWLFAAFVLQALSFAVYIPAGVRYAALVVDSRDAVKAQAFLTLTGTLGSIFSSLSGGYMIDNFGVGATLFAGAAASLIGTVISVAAVVTKKEERT